MDLRTSFPSPVLSEVQGDVVGQSKRRGDRLTGGTEGARPGPQPGKRDPAQGPPRPATRRGHGPVRARCRLRACGRPGHPATPATPFDGNPADRALRLPGVASRDSQPGGGQRTGAGPLCGTGGGRSGSQTTCMIGSGKWFNERKSPSRHWRRVSSTRTSRGSRLSVWGSVSPIGQPPMGEILEFRPLLPRRAHAR